MTRPGGDVTLRCGECGNLLTVASSPGERQVSCPHCQRPLPLPPTDVPFAEPDEGTLVVDTLPSQGGAHPLSNGSSAKITFSAGPKRPPGEDHTWVSGPEMAPARTESAQDIQLGAEPTASPSASSSNPFRQMHVLPAAGSTDPVGMPNAHPPRRVRRVIPFSYWVLSFLLPYALAMTAAVVVLMRNRPPHPLEFVQDQGLYEDLEEGKRRSVIEPNQSLPPNVKPLHLGETQRFGALEVTPRRVFSRKLRFTSFRGIRDYESSDEGLYLALHLKNVGTAVFQPLDPTFNRSFRRDAPPYTFLQIGEREYYGPISDLATERLRGQNLGELQPGDEMDTLVVATNEATPGHPSAVDALKTPSANPLTWRVQLRRGREEITLKDGRKRTTWVTTVVPITFVATDVQRDP